MEYQELFSAGIGALIVWVTNLAKKWPILNSSIAKGLTVLILAGLFNVALLWLMSEPLVLETAFKQGAISAISALLIHWGIKDRKKKNGG